VCLHCGFAANADWNAARNIAFRALAVSCNAATGLATVEAKTGNGTAAEVSRKAAAL
jgi:transposase